MAVKEEVILSLHLEEWLGQTPYQIIGVEKSGVFIICWKNLSNLPLNKGPVSHVGIWHEKTFKTVFVHGESSDIISASISQDHTLLGFTTKEKAELTGQHGDRIHETVFKAYLAEVRPNNHVFSLNLDGDKFIRLQFLYGQYEGQGPCRENHLLVLLVQESVGLYHIPIGRVNDDQFVMAGEPRKEPLYWHRFVWYQWCGETQCLYLIHPKRSEDGRGQLAHLTALQLLPSAGWSVQMKMSLGDLEIASGRRSHYSSRLPAWHRVPDAYLNVEVVSRVTGHMLICWQKSPHKLHHAPPRPSASDLDPRQAGNQVEYKVYSIHQDKVLTCCVGGVQSTCRAAARLVFALLDNYLVVYSPGSFTHLYNIGAEFDLLHPLIVSSQGSNGVVDDYYVNYRSDVPKYIPKYSSSLMLIGQNLVLLSIDWQQLLVSQCSTLNLIHYICVHLRDIAAIKMMLEQILASVTHPQTVQYLTEFLLGLTYALVQDQLGSDHVLYLLPYTTTSPPTTASDRPPTTASDRPPTTASGRPPTTASDRPFTRSSDRPSAPSNRPSTMSSDTQRTQGTRETHGTTRLTVTTGLSTLTFPTHSTMSSSSSDATLSDFGPDVFAPCPDGDDQSRRTRRTSEQRKRVSNRTSEQRERNNWGGEQREREIWGFSLGNSVLMDDGGLGREDSGYVYVSSSAPSTRAGARSSGQSLSSAMDVTAAGVVLSASSSFDFTRAGFSSSGQSLSSSMAVTKTGVSLSSFNSANHRGTGVCNRENLMWRNIINKRMKVAELKRSKFHFDKVALEEETVASPEVLKLPDYSSPCPVVRRHNRAPSRTELLLGPLPDWLHTSPNTQANKLSNMLAEHLIHTSTLVTNSIRMQRIAEEWLNCAHSSVVLVCRILWCVLDHGSLPLYWAADRLRGAISKLNLPTPEGVQQQLLTLAFTHLRPHEFLCQVDAGVLRLCPQFVESVIRDLSDDQDKNVDMKLNLIRRLQENDGLHCLQYWDHPVSRQYLGQQYTHQVLTHRAGGWELVQPDDREDEEPVHLEWCYQPVVNFINFLNKQDDRLKEHSSKIDLSTIMNSALAFSE